MSNTNENPSEPSQGSPAYARWYDKDPALSKALEALKSAPSRYQAQVALNIMKVILEQKLENKLDRLITDEVIAETVESINENEATRHQYRRWYDVNETLRASMNLLADTPDDLLKSMVPRLVELIEKALVHEW
jgi:hypothetical protein